MFSLSTRSLLIKNNRHHSTMNQSREAVKFLFLNNLSDNPGAVKKARRVGRGTGSSKGKTCGRGHKGQKSRSGHGVKPTFEGGQTPFYKTIPKRGFSNKKFAQPMTPLNVGKLQDYIDMGRLTPNKVLTMKDFVTAGMFKYNSIKHGVKLLGEGKLRTPVQLEISRASKTAIAAVEQAGGEITTVHYNRLALRALLKPHKFKVLPRRAKPPPKLMPYYTSFEKRGYLSVELHQKRLMKGKSLQ